jgi:hypothetical protein
MGYCLGQEEASTVTTKSWTRVYIVIESAMSLSLLSAISYAAEAGKDQGRGITISQPMWVETSKTFDFWLPVNCNLPVSICILYHRLRGN